jgi:hypothetical protein
MTPLLHTEFTFILEEFAEGTAGQQLLDRFLIGYNADGEFRSPASKVTLFAQNVVHKEALQSRVNDFHLRIASSLQEAIGLNSAVIAVGTKHSELLTEDFANRIISALPSNARCYFHGVPENLQVSRGILHAAVQKNMVIGCGTSASTPFQLPNLPALDISPVRRGLIVAVGDFPVAEIEALEGIHAVLGPHPTAHADVHVRALTPDSLWQAAYSNYWKELFTSAISRSNTMQGDPEKDGRTQDIAGLRLVEKLTPNPRAWIIQHESRELLILVLNGAVKDFNAAFQLRNGDIASTQLYRPPGPMHDHFSLFAQKVEAFFQSNERSPQSSGLVFIPQVIEGMRVAQQGKS